MNDQIEIRLLGRLWVRSASGQVVPAAHWSTGKTTDLLRLLATKSDQVVSISSLIDKLWPAAPEPKAAASLRTATAQIRKVLGKDSVIRHADGVRLQGCWVDIAAYESLAVEAGMSLRARDFARVVAATKEAEALYVDDFRAQDDDSDWAVEIRDNLRARRKLMLADASESAIELGWLRDAIDLSTLTISLDSCFERAHRSLMRSYAGIGETDSAVRAYERCRRNLSSDLGAAPSIQTQALHNQLLSRVETDVQLSAFVGREDAVLALTDALRNCAVSDGTDVVVLTGSPGSGRESLLQAATDRLAGAHLRPIRPPKIARTGPSVRRSPNSGRIDIAVAGPLDLPPARAHAAMTEVLAAIDPQPGRVLVLITSPEAGDLLISEATRYRPHLADSPSMDEADLRELATMVLAGPPSPDLLSTLVSHSAGFAGAAVEILRAWVATGQIISTTRGLDLTRASSVSTATPAASAAFRLLAEQLEPTDMEICQILAVLDRPITAADVMQILPNGRPTQSRLQQIQVRLDQLTGRGILRSRDNEYAFRDRTTQDSFELWLRPSLRDRITPRNAEHDCAPAMAGSAGPALPFPDRRAPVGGRRATDLG